MEIYETIDDDLSNEIIKENGENKEDQPPWNEFDNFIITL